MPRLGLYIVVLATLLCCARAHALEPVRLAADVYVFYGARGEISAANRGRVGNSGFIVADGGVIVVDTGGSYTHAREMIAAIRRITPKRIRLAIITTPLQEFLFGASAFRDIGAAIVAHVETAKLIRQRCDDCLDRSRRYVGEAAFAGTRLVIPDEQIEHSTSYTIAGRTVDLYHFGWGATPGDLVVFDRTSGIAFAGGLLSIERIPDTHDFNFTNGWHDALDKVRRLGARRIVPGHGPAIAADKIALVQDYLRALDNATRKQFEAGASLSEAVDRVQLPVFQNWDMYGTTHRQNVIAALGDFVICAI
jgi:glyoxylase-like metal-dependent hydrolase (beta-lactamase superfamily II)